MHGGLLCSLCDTMGSLAIASRGFYSTGVSTDIHTTFVKPAGAVGDTMNLSAEVISLGKVMCSTRMEVRDPKSNALLGELDLVPDHRSAALTPFSSQPSARTPNSSGGYTTTRRM